ncbi:T9SS type A sorting domain-containing protein [Candidatus Latescibacterota bacterium]
MASSYSGVLRILGDEPGVIAGLSIASGDINGDGYDDAIIGAMRANPGGKENAGEVFVVFGSESLKSLNEVDTASTPDNFLRIQGNTTGAEFGNAVAAGDMDCDGYDDILIGAWHGGEGDVFDKGEAYIVFGSADISREGVIDIDSGSHDILALYGENPGKVPTSTEFELGDEFGVAVSTGDINGDGFSDAIIGAWYADPYDRKDAGKTYVIFGSPDMRNTGDIHIKVASNVLAIAGVGYGLDYPDNSGFYNGSGDVNGDGFDDVIVGAKFADPYDRANTGEVYIIFGSDSITSTQEIDLATTEDGVVRISGCNPHDYTGSKLNAGDVNGDGFCDVLIDAYGAEAPGRTNPGRAYVVFGTADMENGEDISLSDVNDNVLVIYGKNDEDHLGKPSSGDINGDGIGDLLFQANSADPGGKGSAGEAYVLIGSPGLSSRQEIDLLDSHSDIITIYGDEAGSNMGFISVAGDMDNDGYDDVILGAHSADPKGRSDAGKVVVVWGDVYYQEGINNVLTVDAPEFITPGNTFEVEIVAQDVVNLFGLSFEVHFIVPEYITVDVTESGSFLGEDIVSIISVEEGREVIVSFGLTKKSGATESNGTGVVARLVLNSDPDTPEGTSVKFSLHDINANDAAGTQLTFSGLGATAFLFSGTLVWPGDTNNDGKVNQADVLPIGQFWGAEGHARPSASIRWESQFSKIWTTLMATYADANGNGVINQADVLPIGLNWGKEYDLVAAKTSKAMAGAGTIQPVPLSELPIKAGSEFMIEIRLDDVENLFGLSFVLEYDNSHLIEPLIVENKALLGSDIVFLPYIDTSSGEVAVGMSRKSNQDSVDGTGAVVGITFKALEDITDDMTITFALDQVVANDKLGEALFIEAVTGFLGKPSGITDDMSVPGSIDLHQNSPNPFNPVTSISFTLHAESQTTLTIYDILGKHVETLIDNSLSPGSYSFNWNAGGYSSGTYFYRLKAGGFVMTKRMTLVK